MKFAEIIIVSCKWPGTVHPSHHRRPYHLLNMKFYGSSIVIAAMTAHHTEGFQPAISRKAFFAKVATVTASSAVLLPNVASAAEPKAGKKELLRGGKNASDALHNGTDLNKAESVVASSLLDKMGLSDITPEKGPSSRAPPTRKR